MTTGTHEYRYLAPSHCAPAAAGAEVHLATSGGREPHPFLFVGALDRPRQSARCLLTVASVARTRFYDPVAAASAMLDPVITVHDDLLRFEAFSTCCSVYTRYDRASPAGALGRGTTNIDVNPPMRAALSGVRDRGDLLLSVGHDEVTVTTDRGGAVERKVPLPDRWLKGFAEVQLASAGFVRRFELGAAAARRLLQQLPARATATPAWIVPSGSGARLSRHLSRDAVFVDAPSRLRPMVDLLAFVQRLVVHAPPPAATPAPAGRVGAAALAKAAEHAQPSAWEAHLPDARLVLTLSPRLSRGFSGEGGVLLHAALGERDAADRLSGLLDGQRHLDHRELAGAAGLRTGAVASGLAVLGMLGRLSYDLDADGYFHRDLPFDRDRLERLHPRLRDARDLAAGGAVTLMDQDRADVASGDATYRVRATPAGQHCTCRWYARTAGGQGPCKHVLAVLLVRDRAAGFRADNRPSISAPDHGDR